MLAIKDSQWAKDAVRWELAHVSSELNAVLKRAAVLGPDTALSVSISLRIAELREQRDALLDKLATM